jgi:hypothetical protein
MRPPLRAHHLVLADDAVRFDGVGEFGFVKPSVAEDVLGKVCKAPAPLARCETVTA